MLTSLKMVCKDTTSELMKVWLLILKFLYAKEK